MHFKMSFRLDRARLRDKVNSERTAFIASYEPLVRDVSVSMKYMNDAPLPREGSHRPDRPLGCCPRSIPNGICHPRGTPPTGVGSILREWLATRSWNTVTVVRSHPGRA